jgi:hypothetical protein
MDIMDIIGKITGLLGNLSSDISWLVTSLFASMYWFERKQNEKMSEELRELAKASIKADIEHTQALSALKNVYEIAVTSTKAQTEQAQAMLGLKDAVWSFLNRGPRGG